MSKGKKIKVKKPFYKKWWVWVLAIIVIANIASGGDEEETSTETKSDTKATETTAKPEEKKEEPKKEAPKQHQVGDVVKVGKLEYTVKGVEETQKISNVLGDKTTEGKFVIVEMAIKNLDKKERMADSNMFKIKADGAEYGADAELDMYVNEGGIGFFLETMNPNISKTGKVVFELPTEAKAYNIEVSSGAGWSGGEYEQIKLK
ncbi:DUF4352 domain-containing protein [Peribacillus simplex]|uniref:DUF4352 domain-containing protein n=2 Tax=Peribacillus TaxID=2675229 RepID=A0AA90P3C6_9BACI|nr:MULTISPECIES: DUF4352 domain-containing protein [Peribacillus]MDP1418566.1 DUF4352 domain-containing protein [Peribacillus simplex]MDP1451456.1 DUF4352 domain-containing protein [Peribacillus frigoritolerans]